MRFRDASEYEGPHASWFMLTDMISFSEATLL